MRYKKIKGYEGYSVGTDGHIYNNITGRKLKEWENSTGYLRTQINNDNGGEDRPLLHVIVAEYFVKGKTDKRNQVHHKDNNIKNNAASNLAWVSHIENNNLKAKNKDEKLEKEVNNRSN